MAHVSRRRFLQLAGSGLLIAQSPYLIAQPSKRKVGVALLGLGNYSTNLLEPALQYTQHCELRGIITGSKDKIPQWQKQYGIKDRNVYTYSTMADIANNDDIDVIYVVTKIQKKIVFEIGKHVHLIISSQYWSSANICFKSFSNKKLYKSFL